MRTILTGRIKPLAIFHNTPNEGGGGDAGAAAAAAGEGAKIGSAFSAMLATMSGDGKASEAPPAKEGDENTDSNKGADPDAAAAAAKKKEDDAAAAAAAAAAASGKDGKKRTPRDPLLDVLTGGDASKDKKEGKDGDAGAAAADPAKAAADKAKEIEEATKGLSPKAAENFRTVAAARDAAEKRAEDLQKQLDALKTQQPAITPEVQQKLAKLAELEREHGTLLETMEKIGAERSPTFQKKYVQGRAKLIGKAADLVRKYGGDEAGFKAALELSGRDRSEALQTALADMHQLDSQRVAGVLTEIEALDEDANAFLTNARESLQKEEQEAQQIEQQRAQEMIQARDRTFTEVANKMLHRLPDDHPLAAEANPIVDKAIQDAKKFLFEGNDFNDFARASIAHAMFPMMQQKLAAAAERVAQLEEQLEELANADPGNGGSGGSGGGSPAAETKGFADRFKGAMTGAV